MDEAMGYIVKRVKRFAGGHLEGVAGMDLNLGFLTPESMNFPLFLALWVQCARPDSHVYFGSFSRVGLEQLLRPRPLYALDRNPSLKEMIQHPSTP